MSERLAVRALGPTAIVLKADMEAESRDAKAPDFYPALDRDYNAFKQCHLVSQHSFSEPWGVWEMHPAGDEVVYLLAGDVDFVLRMPDGEKTVRVGTPGEYVIVPKGIWHTAKPHAPTTMLFVTPGAGTRNEVEPPD